MRSASFIGANAVTARPVADALGVEVAPRIISAAVLAPAALVAAYAGGIYFAGLIVAFACVMTWEWARLVGDGRFGGEGAVLMAVVVAALGAGVALGAKWGLAAAILGAIAAAAALRAMGAARPRWAGAGVLYIAVPALALVWLRAGPEWGRACVLLLFAIVWATDIGAYFGGRRFGGPLLAPATSPHKTWSGALGGLVAAVAVSLAAAPLAAPAHPGTLVLFGAVLSVAAQFGDLFESAIKRHFHVKDTSQVIPGHGGVLDRVDGLLAAAPLAAALVWSGVLSPWP